MFPKKVLKIFREHAKHAKFWFEVSFLLNRNEFLVTSRNVRKGGTLRHLVKFSTTQPILMYSVCPLLEIYTSVKLTRCSHHCNSPRIAASFVPCH